MGEGYLQLLFHLLTQILLALIVGVKKISIFEKRQCQYIKKYATN